MYDNVFRFNERSIQQLEHPELIKINEKVSGFSKDVQCKKIKERYNILLTGATGFFGSHLLIELLQNTEYIDKIYCTGVPFSIKDDSFDERTKTECKLFVPNGMYNKYAWESKYWSEFKNIKEYNQNTVDNECVSFNNVNIRVIRRNIVLETVQNTHVSIYNINGTLVFSSSVKNNVSIPLQSGFYIVKYNDETKKIAIL